MTSCSFHLRPSQKWGNIRSGKLYIRVTRHRGSITITTEYAIYPHEWDKAGHCLIFPEDANDPRHQALTEISAAMAADLKRLDAIIASFEASGRDFTAADVRACFTAAPGRTTVGEYAGKLYGRMTDTGRFNTLSAYRSAVSAFRKFCGGRDIALADINHALIRDYDDFLTGIWQRGKMKMNSVSFYLRILRAIYNKAVREGLIAKQVDGIFDGIHTGNYDTKRRAISKEDVKGIMRLEDLLKKEIEEEEKKKKKKKEQQEKRAKQPEGSEGRQQKSAYKELLDSMHLFMFSFYGRGLSFIDMAHLRKQDVQNGHIRYIRSKTGRQMEIRITLEMQRIMDYFASRTVDSPYLFPILDASLTDIGAWRQFKTAHKRYNEQLKELAIRVGIPGKLTSHVARHTWATLAKRENITIEAICEALGHRDIKTTEIYLASFESPVMDDLSDMIEELVLTA